MAGVDSPVFRWRIRVEKIFPHGGSALEAPVRDGRDGAEKRRAFRRRCDFRRHLEVRHGALGLHQASYAVAFALIGKQEGIKGYWKGNLPQVIRIVTCRAVQLFAYET
ncbi:Envelope ADP,ATP carrier protein [Actinidia chinensis var. chinensis]|uniref:Envelope ADP,ATP carrier protein n=1 Tax=Actinidia chinensis var. chinensis TaxID=1590841 RepID=A0A2R6RXC3_ACTCC|nr:Envelope ADP,ATP carrier protein [Actinidia chinensis var. chinensis]